MHILQSPQWAEFKNAVGLEILKIPTQKENLFVSLHPIPHTPWQIAYLPRPDSKLLTLANLKKTISSLPQNTIFLKIEPDLNNKELAIRNCPLAGEAGELKIQEGSQVLPQHTFHLDLDQPEETIFKNMSSKTRYNIRLAQKHQIKITAGKTNKDLNTFLNLQRQTAARQKFSVKPDSYFQTLWRLLKPKNIVYLLLASLPNCKIHQPCYLGGIILFHHQNQLYYPYGASSNFHKELMASHLLHWQAIKLGKQLKADTYDFWGAYKEKPEPADPWFGIYRFKKGFGGQLIVYPKPLDIVLKPHLYKLYKLAEAARPKQVKFPRLWLKTLWS